jgi:hypothetical protein
MTPTPPDGWRILDAGEVTQQGDKFYAHGAWLEVEKPGKKVEKWFAVFFARPTGASASARQGGRREG